MTSPTSAADEYIVVGRVRRAHGIRGELVVESFTDAPGAVFASGRRVFQGTERGDLAPDARELHVVRSSPFKEGLIVAIREIQDRNEAERWRDRYLVARAAELEPPRDNELYIRDLVGMRVQLPSGDVVGTVREVYELPQGLVLEVQREKDTVMIPYHESAVAHVERESRTIHVDPPAGLLD
jgi:16S rRNA processing protein RimM